MKKFLIFCFIITQAYSAQCQDYVISHVSNHNQNHFGWSISSDNDYVAVSDPRDSISFYGNGSVNIYKRFGYEWQYLQSVHNKDIKPYDYFGHKVFMSTKYLAVSSIGDRTMGFMSGAVHIFCLNNGLWTYTQTLRQPLFEDKTDFGECLYISGKYLFIGAPGYGKNGAAFIYSYSENSFKMLQEIDNPDSLSAQFGKSVTYADGWFYIGAPSANMPMQRGGVYLYSQVGEKWELNHTQSMLQPDDEDHGGLFGYSINAEGDNLLVGAPHANVYNESGEKIYFSGKVYYYHYSWETGLYSKIGEFINPDLDSHDLFGTDVMISDSLLYITSPRNEENENDEGSIHIFRNNNGQWISKSLSNKENNVNQYFANNFFVDGYTLFVGSGGNKKVQNKGTIYTYDVRDLLDMSTKHDTKELVDVFPNPADDKFRIAISENVKYTLRICSNDGKERLVKDLKGNNEIDISDFSNGYYLVSVNTEKQSFTESLVIKHKKK